LPTREKFKSISIPPPLGTGSITGHCCSIKLFSLPCVSQKVFPQHPRKAWCKGHSLTFPGLYTSSSEYLQQTKSEEVIHDLYTVTLDWSISPVLHFIFVET